MARQLRIEFPGAFYHVYSRGNQKQPIFFSPDDRYFYLKILGDAHKKLGSLVHVFCLMDNHYHLILQTMLANLSRVMHFINTKYSAYLNAKHGRCGHLFQGRYKSILVQAEAYAQALSKYIHMNPVKNGMIETPEQYQWSSCPEYAGLRKPPSWLITSVVLELFADDPGAARTRYMDYLLSETALPDREFSRAVRLGILGSPEFIEGIRSALLNDEIISADREIPQLRQLKKRPELSSIHDAVLKRLGAENRLARKATIFIAHKNTDYKLREIGAFLGIGPTAVSLAFARMRKEISPGSPIECAIREIEAELFRKRSPQQET